MTDSRQAAGRRPSPLAVLLALLVALTLVVAGCGGRDDDEPSSSGGGTTAPSGDNGDGGGSLVPTEDCPSQDDFTVGTENNTIKLGTSIPQSGLYSTFKEILEGSRAYFNYINAQGGVEVAGQKYEIELIDKDDAYESVRTVENIRELTTDEQVFSLFNVVGTKNNLAIRDTINEDCVPDVFAATGSPAWGNHDYPWLLGTFLVPYPLEALTFVNYLKENKPNAKVAILRAADDFGRAYSETFASLIEGTDITIVKEETYNPEETETKPQVTSLAASNADTLLLAATLLACPNALNNVGSSGWKPLIYMSGTCTSKTLMGIAGANGNNVLSVSPLLDPADPANQSSEAMQLYKTEAAKTAQDVENGIVAYGWSAAAAMVETLERTPTLDRPSLMETARTLDLKDIGLQLPEASWITNADDWFLGEEFNLVQYSTADGYFKTLQFINEEGKTAEITPENLIYG
jgi:branched-chain amino acid transport system substrate-binding protein